MVGLASQDLDRITEWCNYQGLAGLVKLTNQQGLAGLASPFLQ